MRSWRSCALSLAALFALTLSGYVGKMTVVGTIGRGLTWVAGRGAVFMPIGLAWVAIELLIGTDPAVRRRRFFGLLFFAGSSITFLDLIMATDGRDGGGEIGTTLGNAARFVAGDAGAGVVCFALGLIGVYLLTGIHVREVIHAWQRTSAARAAKSRERRELQSRRVTRDAGGTGRGRTASGGPRACA